MGKRSNFQRKPHDLYNTPYEALLPLLPHLPKNTQYCEPCAGEGHLIRSLWKHGHRCVSSFDIDPQHGYTQLDAAFMTVDDLKGATHIITNPPWKRPILHQLIDRFVCMRPTWLLFDADWAHTEQAKPYMTYCHMIVAVGRVKWFGNTVGKENACWYLFDSPTNQTRFVGR
jgi:hypothetical protein